MTRPLQSPKGVGLSVKRLCKKRIAAALLLAAFAVGLFSGCSSGQGKAAPDRETPAAAQKRPYAPLGTHGGLDVAAETDRLALLYDPGTTMIGIWDKASGKVWESGPDKAALAGIDRDEVRAQAMSSVILRYYSPANAEVYLNSFADSVAKSQFAVYSIENGIRLEYTVGEAESVDVYPRALTADYVEKNLLPKMEESVKDRFLQYFQKFVFDDTDETLRKNMADTYRSFGKTVRAIYIAQNAPVRFKRIIRDGLLECGLDPETLEAEYKKLACDFTPGYMPSFFIPVEFTLRDGGLQTRVPCGEIEYLADRFKLVDLQLLPFFGARASGSDGYMVVPDGSGVLVNLDNKSKDALAVEVYGEDVNQSAEDAGLIKETCHLPVYGMKAGDGAYLTVLEKGASMAVITSVPSNNLTGMNHIYAAYTVHERQVFAPNGLVRGAEFVWYGEQRYEGDILETRLFLSGEAADYAGMAAAFRERLFAGRDRAFGGAVFNLETYGVIDREEETLGFKHHVGVPYTTVADAAQMAARLKNAGIGRIDVRYRNWEYDPKEEKPALKGRPYAKLGSPAELKAWISDMAGTGDVYLDYEPMYAVRLPASDYAALDIQRMPLRERPAAQGTEGTRYVLNADGLTDFFRRIGNAAGAVSLAGVGRDLYSDYNKNNYWHREDMARLLAKETAALGEDRKVAVDGANAYLLSAADKLWNIPSDSSRSRAQDEVVPFLQMVLHGYVPYTVGSVNLAYSGGAQFLKTMETGAQLQFTFGAGDPAVLKGTQYSGLFSARLDSHLETAADMYRRYKAAADAVGAALITGYRRPAEGVTETAYDNGRRLVVNYGSKAYAAGGVTVPANDFALIPAAPAEKGAENG